MAAPIGIIGVGHLAGYLVEGFSKPGNPIDILLSPRGERRAKALAANFRAEIARDNAEVVARSEQIILATRPDQAIEAVRGLPWRAGQTLTSVAAGIELAALGEVVHGPRLVRAMPVSSAAIGESPTSIFPDVPETRSLFRRLGPVIAFPDEASFRAASVAGAFYAWIFALIQEGVGWMESAGMSPRDARLLVAQATRGAAGMVLSHPGESLQSMLANLATPGGITEQGLATLEAENAWRAWKRACDAAWERLGD